MPVDFSFGKSEFFFFKCFTISKAPYYLIGSGIDRKVYIKELGTMRTWRSQSYEKLLLRLRSCKSEMKTLIPF